MKFLVDMPLSPNLAKWLSDKGHDASHASNVGLHNAPDAAILAAARINDRVVITADLDYPRLLATTGSAGPGLILFRGGNYKDAEIFERLTRVLDTIDQETLERSIVVVERSRIRRRPLPIE